MISLIKRPIKKKKNCLITTWQVNFNSIIIKEIVILMTIYVVASEIELMIADILNWF